MPAPFSDYEIAAAYDEMFLASGRPRPHYRNLYTQLLNLPPEELHRSKNESDLAFFNQGITFTVYGRAEATEQIFPHDLLPRIVTNSEWATIERGLTQRITALNLFLADVYHEGRILKDGVIPGEIIYTCKHFRRQMHGVKVPRDVYISVAGTDLVRLPDGRFVVLEDNLRVPSGVSYMLTSRKVMKQIFPALFRKCGVRPIEQYSQALYGGIVREVNGALANFETIKRFRVVADEWTQESGELTPSMKLKRRIITAQYSAVIDELYADEATARGE